MHANRPWQRSSVLVSPGSSVLLQTEGKHILVKGTIAAANRSQVFEGFAAVTLTSSFGIADVAVAIAVAGLAASPPSHRIAKVPGCAAEASKVE